MIPQIFILKMLKILPVPIQTNKEYLHSNPKTRKKKSKKIRKILDAL